MATEEDKQFYKEHRHEPYQQLERAMKSRDLRKIRYLIRTGKVDPSDLRKIRYLIRTGKVDPNVRLCSFMSSRERLLCWARSSWYSA